MKNVTVRKETLRLKSQSASNAGFTLAEMSIVIVIIGFIVGGVVMGRDMIRASGIRATVSQVEEYQTAVNTFQDKYMALPGDIRAEKAEMYGFTTRSGAEGHGDGNGLLEGCAEGAMIAGCETVLFWADLADAELIKGDYTAVDDIVFMAMWDGLQDTLEILSPIQSAYAGNMMGGGMELGGGGGGEQIGDPELIDPEEEEPTYELNMRSSLFPDISLGGEGSIIAFSDGNTNYLHMGGITATDETGAYTLYNTITPAEALAIDTKLDDGKPMTGAVRAMGGTTLNTSAVPSATTCVYDDSSAYPYNMTTSELADSKLCQLRVGI